MEVGGPLPPECAVGRGAPLRGTEPLESLLEDCGILAVVVGMHLHIRRRDVDLGMKKNLLKFCATIKYTNQ